MLSILKKRIEINNQPLVDKLFSKYDIHYVDYWMNIWNEVNGKRPSLIFKNNRYKYWYDTIVIPLSSSKKWNGKYKKQDNFDIHIIPDNSNHLRKESILKIRQIRTVSKIRIWRKIGTLSNTLDGEYMYDILDKKVKSMIGIK